MKSRVTKKQSFLLISFFKYNKVEHEHFMYQLLGVQDQNVSCVDNLHNLTSFICQKLLLLVLEDT